MLVVVLFRGKGDRIVMNRHAGLIIIAVGVGVVLLGLIVWSGALKWFGRLPGDIRVERDSVHIYVPITSTLVVSCALSLAAYLIRRLFGG
jgi:hypothetical protein